jgi:hypothetical protein
VNKHFKDYVIYTNLSWYSSNTPLKVLNFRYTLSQYTPSIYASIDIILTPNEFFKFKKIDSIEILNRDLEVWFVPELKNDYDKTSYFSGPFKLIVASYKIKDIPKYFKGDPISKQVETSKLVTLQCVDKVFYSMTLTKKFRSFRNTLASDVVQSIISENGGNPKAIESTDYKFTWLQAQMTDYTMVRSLIPYSKTSDNKTCFTFFMHNNDGYFSYIGSGNKKPHLIKIDKQMQEPSVVSNEDLKLLIEKFGIKNSLKVSHHGFSNFKTYSPDSISLLSYTGQNSDWKQHDSTGSNFLMNTIENDHLIKNYISNLRHRVNTFSRIITVNLLAIPDITPLDTIELDHTFNGQTRPFENIYYVGAVSYYYPGNTGSLNILPSMVLYLLSETDSMSVMSPEGAPIG